MRHSILILALALGAPALRTDYVLRATAPDVTGGWVITLDMSMGVAEPTLSVKQDGEKLTGVYAGSYGDYPVSGTVKGAKIVFSFTMRPGNNPVVMTFTGDVASDGESMKGDADLGELGKATWTAKKAKTREKT